MNTEPPSDDYARNAQQHETENSDLSKIQTWKLKNAESILFGLLKQEKVVGKCINEQSMIIAEVY